LIFHQPFSSKINAQKPLLNGFDDRKLVKILRQTP